jgi:signal peptidase II
MKKIKWETLLVIFSAIIFLDRIFKVYLQDSCIAIFCIRRASNPGAAFGIFPGQLALFIAVSIVVLALTAYFWKNVKIRLGLALIAAGTIGNLIDRLIYGSIMDIFSIAGSSSFNLADLSIFIGALILVVLVLKSGKD